MADEVEVPPLFETPLTMDNPFKGDTGEYLDMLQATVVNGFQYLKKKICDPDEGLEARMTSVEDVIL